MITSQDSAIGIGNEIKNQKKVDFWSNFFFFIFCMSLWFIFCANSLYEIDSINLASGIIISILSILCLNKLKIAKKNINLLKKFRFYSYAKNLLKDIFIATMDMVRIIWGEKISLKSKISHIEKKSDDDLELTLISNAITLTPGTIVIALEKDKMIIHSIESDKIVELSNSNVEKNIKNISQNG